MVENQISLSGSELQTDVSSATETAQFDVKQKALWKLSSMVNVGVTLVGLAVVGTNMSSAGSSTSSAAESASSYETRSDTAVGVYHAIEKLYLSYRPRDRKIAERLTELYRDALAEQEEMSSGSALQFANFLLAHRELSFPMITLSQRGNLRARWIRSDDDYLPWSFSGRLKPSS